MEIIDYFEIDDKQYWLSRIQKSDWGAGKYLYELIVENRLKDLCGKTTKVLLLIEKKELISFCTYAEQDDIREPTLSPWVGFVYTFPEFRGKHCMGSLLDYIHTLAKKEGHTYIYISTEEIGLYEKYGYRFWKIMKDIAGHDSRVYRMKLENKTFSRI